jgi:hypothetical protein
MSGVIPASYKYVLASPFPWNYIFVSIKSWNYLFRYIPLPHSLSSAFIFNLSKMISNIFVASTLFVASALAAAEPAPYTIGVISLNPAFGLAKRQAGYAPTQTFCGPGADCAASCGAGYVQCDSTDGDTHCYDPGVQQTCCPDGSGNSCDEGYFCTSDSTGGTWCCPNVS